MIRLSQSIDPLLLLVAVCPTALAAERPNVVYIMADELGYYELSCMGNSHIRTPRIDRMASEGIRSTQALAGSSVCASCGSSPKWGATPEHPSPSWA